ncbi:MAG: ATP-binding protein, partial [Rhodococcus sp. (in: high G+C Gram-positive bacteria)]
MPKGALIPPTPSRITGKDDATTMGQRKSQSLDLMNWRLSYKLAVVLVIPLLAAIALGALRVSAQVDETRRFSSLSEQMEVIPALLDFSNVVVSQSTAASLGLDTSPITPEMIDSAIARARNLASEGDLDPAVNENLGALLDDGLTLYNSIQGGTMSRAELKTRTVDFLTRCAATYRALLDLTENTEVLNDGTNTLNAWNAQRPMLDQMTALGVFATNPDAGQMLALDALDLEQSTLGLLRGSSVDTGQIDGMMASIDKRRNLITNFVPTPAAGEEVRSTMVASAQPYLDLIAVTTDRMTATLDRLTSEARSAAIRDSIIVVTMLAVTLVIVLLVGRTLTVPMRRLRDGVLGAANHELPAAIAAVKDGADVTTVELAPIDVHTTE